VEEHTENFIQADTVLGLIEVKRFLEPLLEPQCLLTTIFEQVNAAPPGLEKKVAGLEDNSIFLMKLLDQGLQCLC
jgi:hypothetical protein